MVKNNQIINIVFCYALLFVVMIFTSGCAVSGCGNPHSSTDNNTHMEYLQDGEEIPCNNPQHRYGQNVRKSKAKRKYYGIR